MQDLTVFISYRRADASADAGRLYDALRRRFGRENLFMDVDSLRPGEDWVDAIEGAVTRCDVLLAVIGPAWAGATDNEGAPRLQKELDRVRLEIEAALRAGKPVIPVLVEGASMPAAEQLPESLQPLLRRHAIHVAHATFESDLASLVRALRIIDRARHPQHAAAARTEAPPAVAPKPPLVITPAPEVVLPAPPPAQMPRGVSQPSAGPSTPREQPKAPREQPTPPLAGAARPADTPFVAPPVVTPPFVAPPVVTPPFVAPPVVTPPYAAPQPPQQQPPAYGAPPYGAPAQPYGYARPAAPYAGTPPTREGGTSPLVIGLLGLGFVLVIGFVLLAVLRIGPFAATAEASPTPSPTDVVPTQPPPTATPTLPPATTPPPATPSPAPTATVAPSATTPAPSGTPAGRTAFPESEFAPIWAVVPTDIRGSCAEDSTFSTPRLSCYVAAQQISIWYEKFSDAASLDAAYSGWLSFDGITSNVGDCFKSAVPCEGPYDVGGFSPAGRVGGIVKGTDGWLYWSHDPALILGTALITVDSSHSFSDLFGYWENTASSLNFTASPSP